LKKRQHRYFAGKDLARTPNSGNESCLGNGPGRNQKSD